MDDKAQAVYQPLPLERAEKQLFDRLYIKVEAGDYDECRQIIDIMERLSLV